MGKYDGLHRHLLQHTGDRITLGFEEVARLVGGLPPSAYEHQAWWWANTRSHPNSVAWLDAGWEVVSRDLRRRRVTLRRTGARVSFRERAPTSSDDAGGPAPQSRRPLLRPQRERSAGSHVAVVIDEFPALLDYYDRVRPFSRSGQYAGHRRTIDLRREAGSVAAAIEDDRYLVSLYGTLQAWGIGRRASRLAAFDAFVDALREWSRAFERLDDLTIDAPSLASRSSGESVWACIEGLPVVSNQARLVAVSKTLHHLLPDLVPPIDRMYTQQFFGFQSSDFQYRQRRTFDTMWGHFVGIARAVGPAQYVGAGWRTSRTKVIDNAIVALVHREREASA